MFDLPPLPPVQPSVEVVVGTDYVSKGVSQNAGDTTYTVRGEAVSGRYVAGVAVSGVNVDGADTEIEASLGANGEAFGLKLNGTVAYTNYVGTYAGQDNDMVEVRASAARKFGPVTGTLAVAYTPDDFGIGKESTFVEASAAVPVTTGATVSGGIGRNDTTLGNYNTFNIGLTQKLPLNMAVDLRYYNTGKVYGVVGEAGDRTVVTLTSRF